VRFFTSPFIALSCPAEIWGSEGSGSSYGRTP
jgi:hypothetical protein